MKVHAVEFGDKRGTTACGKSATMTCLTGNVTFTRHGVTCERCRKVLGLRKLTKGMGEGMVRDGK